MFKQDFPIFNKNQNLVFLDSASSTQKPNFVIDWIKNFLETDYSNIHRWAYDLSMNSSTLYDQSKRKLAQFLSASSLHEIVYTYNATYAFNLIVRSLIKTKILQKNDTVLLSKAEHHANIVPWQIIQQEYGINIEWIELNNDWTINYNDLEKKIGKVKILSISGASNVTGEILDIKKVSEIIKNLEEKPLWIVDGSQRLPHIKTNVEESGIDIFVWTWHKIMSDTGIWFFYGKKELLKKMNPAFCGGGAINGVTIEKYEPAGLPFRHEPGTPHIVGAVSLLKSLEYIENIGGYEKIEKYEQELVEYALEKIQKLPENIKLIGPKNPKNRLWVFSFYFQNHHPHDVAEQLADLWICVRSWHHCAEPLHEHLWIWASLRASLYIYNNKEDIDQFLEKLIKIAN